MAKSIFQNTKIIATIGPASSSFDNLLELAKAGVDVFRLNFSHGSHEEHLEVINHIVEREIKVGSRDFGGLSATDIIVTGEKRTDKDDYYMATGNFPGHIEQYRHGLSRGSNYLYLDWHVATQMPKDAKAGIDPWDVPKPPEPPPPPAP